MGPPACPPPWPFAMANPASERAPAATIANFVELTNFMISLSLCWTCIRAFAEQFGPSTVVGWTPMVRAQNRLSPRSEGLWKLDGTGRIKIQSLLERGVAAVADRGPPILLLETTSSQIYLQTDVGKPSFMLAGRRVDITPERTDE